MIHGLSEKPLTSVSHTKNCYGFTSHFAALGMKQKGAVESEIEDFMYFCERRVFLA